MKKKTEVLTVRVTSEFKKALRESATRCRRSQANFLENLVMEHWQAHSIPTASVTDIDSRPDAPQGRPRSRG